LSLINDLLDVARIESGKIELQSQPVSCQRVIQHLVETLGPLASVKGLQFVVDMPHEEIVVETDERALSQILINLINNAIKFTERGCITIALAATKEGGMDTRIDVIDTGVGIKDEDRPKLFQAFTQLDSSTTRRFEGTGLGLYLSQKLATLIGGKLSFASEFGTGSCFSLLLSKHRNS
jgi:signal transduction histidine kinase